MGRQIFKSQEYLNRNRIPHDYVYDLYKSYLQREPDQSGWDFWTPQVTTNGPDAVRAGFELSTEFATKVASLCPISSSGTWSMTSDGLASVTYDAATNRITNSGFIYDDAGNQMRKVRADGSAQKFQYDAANRLVKVTDDYGYVLGTYTYGDSTERLIAEEGNTRTYYACDGTNEYVEFYGATSPAWSKTYVYMDGSRLLATTTPNGSGGELTQYHHPDRLGTRIVTNAQDTNFFEQQTLPFGTPLNESAPAGGTTGATNKRFTSYDRSITTGLDYANNRHYDSEQGRFTQVDPAGMRATSLSDPQTLNLYAYCANDPVNKIDPSGLGFLSWIKKIFKRIIHALIHAALRAIFTFLQTLLMTGNFGAAVAAGLAAGVADFLKEIGWPSKGWWKIVPGGTPQWNPNSIPILANGPSQLSRWIIWNFQGGGAGADKFITAYGECLSSLKKSPAPGVTQTAYLIQTADTEGTDRTLMAVTWKEESKFQFYPETGLHSAGEKDGDIGPGQLFPGIWEKTGNDTKKGLIKNPFGTNREYQQPRLVFNGDPFDNLRLTARALGGARGQARAKAAAMYRAGSPKGAGYKERLQNFKDHYKNYDAFFNCLRGKGF